MSAAGGLNSLKARSETLDKDEGDHQRPPELTALTLGRLQPILRRLSREPCAQVVQVNTCCPAERCWQHVLARSSQMYLRVKAIFETAQGELTPTPWEARRPRPGPGRCYIRRSMQAFQVAIGAAITAGVALASRSNPTNLDSAQQRRAIAS
eukprot:4390-Heterococcus_DN1.PRE.3